MNLLKINDFFEFENKRGGIKYIYAESLISLKSKERYNSKSGNLIS